MYFLQKCKNSTWADSTRPQTTRWNHFNLEALTNPSMHGDSLMAPQQPRKPTTIIRAPAAIRMYTPAERKTSRLVQRGNRVNLNFTGGNLDAALDDHKQHIYCPSWKPNWLLPGVTCLLAAARPTVTELNHPSKHAEALTDLKPSF